MIELAGSAAHVVVEDVEAPELDGPDQHHLRRVLRLRAGETVTVTDGRGAWRWCRWTGDGVAPDGPVGRLERPSPPVVVGCALVKGDRFDWVVQKLTEVGVDRIVPLAAERAVVRWDGERGRAQVERLRRIAREAVMQSRRVWLPLVDEVMVASVVLATPGAMRADFDGRWLDELPSQPFVVIGPEGGWSASEREISAESVRLSDQVLRAETAAVVAGALLVDLRRRGEGVVQHPS